MQTLKAVDPKQATGEVKEVLDRVQAKYGRVSNLLKTLANSPAALNAYFDFAGSLSRGLLSPKLREEIAVAVAEASGCEYCLSAHTAVGKMVGLSEHELAASRRFRSEDARRDAALQFAHEIVVRRGELDASDVEQVRQAGYSDGEIAEIIANVGLNIFTNYFNMIARTDLDFPKVSLASKSTTA